MDPESPKPLTRLIDTQRVAALGTLRDGVPFVSLVPVAVAHDATVSFYIHISRLAEHTHPGQSRYLMRFPDAAFTFNLADFSFFRIVPSRVRYVAGFGRIFDLSVAELVDPNALSR